MSMIAGEKYWEKPQFAKAEMLYREMLTKDVCLKSSALDRIANLKFPVNASCARLKSGSENCEKYRILRNGLNNESSTIKQSLLVSEIAKAREHIKNSLAKMDGISSTEFTLFPSNIMERVHLLEQENANLKKLTSTLNEICLESQKRITALEELIKSQQDVAKAVVDDDVDGVDLFASDSEEESEVNSRIRKERLAAYAAKKAKKPNLIAKSSLVLDVKPWDDETDLKKMEHGIRKISTDGLLWGASKLVPVAFGINKLSISCVVEDDKVSIDWLTDEIEKIKDYVQSVDIAAFNKI